MSFDAITAFLSDPATHGTPTPVEVVRTHGALVFLSEADAYKVKRPVTYDYLDFSTLEKRKAMLDRELELNRPTAPEIYLGLVPVTRAADGGLRLGGEGQVVEWCLHMRRFPKGAELSEMAARGMLTRTIAEDLGRVVAALHARAEIRDADGAALVSAVADELETTLAGMTDVLPHDAVTELRGALRDRIDRQSDLLRARGRAGFIRRGHGDLHLGNIVLLDGRPVPFDALEFSERLGTLDVLYDLAFLLMDLLHRDLSEAANAALTSYLFHAGAPDHLDALALMPLFLALRAAIRAMVSVQAGRLSDEDRSARYAEARAYLDAARAHLSPPPPRLIAVGGLSGTGKTTLATRLSPHVGPPPGAIHLRSDLERKALYGVDPLTPLPNTAYTPEVSARVYDRLLDKARRVLSAGHSVVVDAVFAREDERRRLGDLAKASDANLTGLWLTVDAETMVERVETRQGDASDADAAVVRHQLEQFGPAPDWAQIDASGTPEATLIRALRRLDAP
ncbi:hypothetical protein RA2_02964 [Roseovarius sp. A-2]|uniref:bifunctional aminoglycoside phosphotransferase/ATP-binding protein n=1 Tax=Roseovarius sp. A-2 TaxID=1570360 RepID=UPI0009B5322D|nr:bifunctional aminoglycoside phosphotransferase/ATP-binding protein [Roseovarius sp. A-2]GAW35896.1 hypothetical protein RA2_02964 [Roseovarius sp. A-2]